MENKKYSIKEIVDLDIKHRLRQNFQEYGIERTEDKIKDLYKGKARTKLLYYYQELIRR